MYSVRNLNNGKRLVRFMNESVDSQEIYVNTRKELDNLLREYPSGSPRVVVGNGIDLSYLFLKTEKNIDISNWDVSNVTSMRFMFCLSNFNGDISKWDVSNVRDMRSMFAHSKFDGDISKWDVSNVTNMKAMFSNSKFNGDISNWMFLVLITCVPCLLDLISMVIFLTGMSVMLKTWSGLLVVLGLMVIYHIGMSATLKVCIICFMDRFSIKTYQVGMYLMSPI